MAANWVRVLLAANTQEKELVAIGGKNNWSLVKINAKSDNQPAERIYQTKDGATQVTWAVTMEREGGQKPAMVADWIARLYA